jgi:hypothetical protein
LGDAKKGVLFAALPFPSLFFFSLCESLFRSKSDAMRKRDSQSEKKKSDATDKTFEKTWK